MGGDPDRGQLRRALTFYTLRNPCLWLDSLGRAPIATGTSAGCQLERRIYEKQFVQLVCAKTNLGRPGLCISPVLHSYTARVLVQRASTRAGCPRQHRYRTWHGGLYPPLDGDDNHWQFEHL